jgi:hypothetical protein
MLSDKDFASRIKPTEALVTSAVACLGLHIEAYDGWLPSLPKDIQYSCVVAGTLLNFRHYCSSKCVRLHDQGRRLGFVTAPW